MGKLLGLACIAHKSSDQPATLRVAMWARRSDAGGEFVSDAGSGGNGILRLRRTNHAAFFSLLMGSPRKNGRLGDPALPSLSPARTAGSEILPYLP